MSNIRKDFAACDKRTMTPLIKLRISLYFPKSKLGTHSRGDLFRVFDIGFGQIEDILGIILTKEFFKKSN